MTQTIDVPAFEHGVVRVLAGRFASEDALRAYALPDGERWPLRDELGVEALDPKGVEAFAVSKLGEMGLPGYLRMAYGVSDGDAARASLAGAEGHVILLSSRAFGGRAHSLALPDRLERLGAFRDAEAAALPAPATPLAPARDGAGAQAAPATPPTAAAGPSAPTSRLGRAAGAGLLVLGALVVAGGVVANERWLWLPGIVLAAAGAAIAAGTRRRGRQG